MINPWLLLILTIITESVGIYFQKISNGFERLIPTVLMALCFIFTIWGTGMVMKHIEMGITFAIWAGGSIALTAILGILLFQEDMSLIKLSGIVAIIVGVVLLNLASKTV